MPNRDGTGPLGRGAMTGRGCGPCGCGQRRGAAYLRARLPLSKNEEKEALERELEVIEKEKQEVEKRLKELK